MYIYTYMYMCMYTCLCVQFYIYLYIHLNCCSICSFFFLSSFFFGSSIETHTEIDSNKTQCDSNCLQPRARFAPHVRPSRRGHVHVFGAVCTCVYMCVYARTYSDTLVCMDVQLCDTWHAQGSIWRLCNSTARPCQECNLAQSRSAYMPALAPTANCACAQCISATSLPRPLKCRVTQSPSLRSRCTTLAASSRRKRGRHARFIATTRANLSSQRRASK